MRNSTPGTGKYKTPKLRFNMVVYSRNPFFGVDGRRKEGILITNINQTEIRESIEKRQRQ